MLSTSRGEKIEQHCRAGWEKLRLLSWRRVIGVNPPVQEGCEAAATSAPSGNASATGTQTWVRLATGTAAVGERCCGLRPRYRLLALLQASASSLSVPSRGKVFFFSFLFVSQPVGKKRTSHEKASMCTVPALGTVNNTSSK